MKKASAAVWAVWIILTILIAAGLVYYYQFTKLPQLNEQISNLQDQVKNLQKQTNNQSSDLETYTNKTYGFSFKYPSSWEEQTLKMNNTVKKESVFSIQFIDPERESDREASNCISNEKVNWVNPSPTQAECQPILNNLSAAEKEKLDKRLSARNIYVIVFKPTSFSDLKNWLISHYRIPNSELADYNPGAAITLSGENGFASSISCCGGCDFSYVAKKGDYIYQFGTNNSDDDKCSSDNSIFKQLVGTFQFIQQ